MDQAVTRAAGATPSTMTPAAAPRLVGEFQGFVDGEPFVAWADRTRMPNVGEKLYAGMAPAVGAGGYALTEERIDQEWNSLDGFKIHPGQGLADWDRARRVAFARAIERALAASAGAAARSWSILLTSANHGTVGPLGSTFPHAGEHHERVVVVEVPAAAGAPSDEVNLVLCAAPAIRAGANTALEEERIWQLYREAQDQGTSSRGTSPTVHFARAIEREVAAQAGQVEPVADMTKEQIVHRAIVELRVFAPHELRQDGQVALAWKPMLKELVEAMRRYEMDAESDGAPPYNHRDMMQRAEAMLAASAAAGQVAVPEWRGIKAVLTNLIAVASVRIADKDEEDDQLIADASEAVRQLDARLGAKASTAGERQEGGSDAKA